MILTRQAIQEDIPQIEQLIKGFFETLNEEDKIRFDLTYTDLLIRNILATHLLLVLVKDKKILGGLGGLIGTLAMNGKMRVFQEVFFYILPTYRRYSQLLLNAIEKEVKRFSVDLVIMAHLADDNHEKMDRFYGARGYKLLEKHYYKRVK